MIAVRTLMTAVRGRKYVGMIQERPTDIHAMRFDGPADTLFIVWADQPRNHQKVEYPKQGLLSASGLMGKEVKSKARRSGKAQIEIDDTTGPIYLRWTAGSRGVPHPK